MYHLLFNRFISSHNELSGLEHGKRLLKRKQELKFAEYLKLQITNSHAASGSELVCHYVSVSSVYVKTSYVNFFCAGSNSHTEFEMENRTLLYFCCVM